MQDVPNVKNGHLYLHVCPHVTSSTGAFLSSSSITHSKPVWPQCYILLYHIHSFKCMRGTYRLQPALGVRRLGKSNHLLAIIPQLRSCDRVFGKRLYICRPALLKVAS